jgi:hypothetical protein
MSAAVATTARPALQIRIRSATLTMALDVTRVVANDNDRGDVSNKNDNTTLSAFALPGRVIFHAYYVVSAYGSYDVQVGVVFHDFNAHNIVVAQCPVPLSGGVHVHAFHITPHAVHARTAGTSPATITTTGDAM